MLIEKTAYGGWPNCYRIANGEIELVLTSDIGPRIMRAGFLGGQNFFREFEDQMGTSGETVWMPRGGHRVWIAPEDPVKSYAPENGPVEVRVKGHVVEAIQPVEELTGIEKKLTVRMAEHGATVEVIHTLRNAGSHSVHVAPWALSMMARGGHGIHGFPARGTHPEMLAPTNPLVMWAFTDLGDPRWRFLKKYLVLRQDPANSVPQKLGTWNAHTWGAYLLNGELFVKRYTPIAEVQEYPDYGCCYETFTNQDILELETLGPVTALAPGESLNHTERWSMHRGVNIREWTDDELDRVLGPLVA